MISLRSQMQPLHQAVQLLHSCIVVSVNVGIFDL